MLNRLKYLVFIFFTFGFISCKVTDQTVPRNLDRIYDPASSAIHPLIAVYNTSDTSSIIIEKLYTKELLFNQANDENKLMARIKVIYNLYDLGDKHKMVDSLTTTFKLDKSQKRNFFNLEIDVKAKIGYDYFLEIITVDQNRKNSQYSFRRIDRSGESSLLDYSIYNKTNGEYIIDPFLKENLQFGVKNYKKSIDSLNVFYFPENINIPQVPYLNDSIRENFSQYDTTWVCYLDSIDYSEFKRKGVYYFTSADQARNGFTLFNFGNSFPVVRTPENLIKPLVYLGYNDSLPENDSTGKLTKLKVDQFWLKRAKNMDKSRELIKAYYNRVLFANMYFTSFKEGWQTDRGMIYIIYGLPDYLFKSGDEEKWIYNPTGIDPGISFSFKYYHNPFSLNHYVLDRDKLKSTGWDEAVKMWNNGEVFYYQNQLK